MRDNDREGLIRRLRAAMRAAGITNTELAGTVGVTVQAVGDWLRRGMISSERLPVIARALGTSVDYLLTGRNLENDAAQGVSPVFRQRVPILPAEDVVAWALGEMDQQQLAESALVTRALGPRAYGLRLTSGAMAPTYPDGALVIVDPDATQRNGDVVVYRIDGSPEPIIKRLVLDAGRRFLQSEDPRVPLLELGGSDLFLGVVRQVVIDL